MVNQTPPKFSDDQMTVVRQTDLPALLESLGYKVKPKGSYHTLADMPHIMIKGRTSYYDNYNQSWGDGITFLREFHNMDFEEAVNHLLAWGGHFEGKNDEIKLAQPAPPRLESKAPFQLPESNEDNRRAYAYLLKRGISRHVISRFINNGLLYECKEYHNCVFVGKDQDGNAAFAYKRGTYDKDGNGFKGDVSGSDKSVAFRLPAHPNLSTVYVFESPLCKAQHKGLYEKQAIM